MGSRSRSLLHQKENTPYGSEDPSWLPSPPSNRCGSPSKNTTNAAHPLSTENASKLYLFYCYIIFNLLFMLFDANFIFMFNSNIPKNEQVVCKPTQISVRKPLVVESRALQCGDLLGP